jgi:hypothetical protein
LPGQIKTVSFSLPFDELSFWDVSRHAFVARKGEWDVMVGGSSSDIKITGKISVTGEGLAKQSQSQGKGEIAFNQIGTQGYRISFKETGRYRIDILKLDGRHIDSFEGKSPATFWWQPVSSGVYLVKVKGATFCKHMRVCIGR